MPTIQLKDANGTTFNFEVSRDGTPENPYIPLSDLSVAGVPVTAGNPVPVSVKQQDSSQFNELFTIDTNLSDVLGTQPVNDGAGRLNTALSKYAESAVAFKVLSGLNQEVAIDCTGYATCLIDVSTPSFSGWYIIEGLVNDTAVWTLVPCNYTTSGAVAITSWNSGTQQRASIAGYRRLRVRCSAWQSGSVQVTLKCTTAPYAPTGMYTTDSSLQQLLGYSGSTPAANYAAIVRPAQEPMPIAPLTPIINATPLSNFLGKQRQYYARMRVETGGDKKLPFAQEDNTFKQIVTDPDQNNLLEMILLELKALNEMLSQQNTPPTWWEQVK